MAFLELHPISIKQLERGHPWITSDEFSQRFPQDKQLLNIHHPHTNKFLGQFINDFKHPKIKARFWSFEKGSFEEIFLNRWNRSWKKRAHLIGKRENVYLCFGEADGLPGLYIQKLSDHLLIQYQAYFWENKITNLIPLLMEAKEQIAVKHLWSQKRLHGEKKEAPLPLTKHNPQIFKLKEGSIQFEIRMHQGHDIGVFTDMASIRKSLNKELVEKKSMLNLFSYTGAFSLIGLLKGMQVCSVDVSKKYMEWLEKNISLNSFDLLKHKSLVSSVDNAIKKLIEDNQKFDIIICDPPSVSTDKKRKISNLEFYKNQLGQITKLMHNKSMLCLFINTHNLDRTKLRSKLDPLFRRFKLKLIREVALSEDCPQLKCFPQGDYLKGDYLTR